MFGNQVVCLKLISNGLYKVEAELIYIFMQV